MIFCDIEDKSVPRHCASPEEQAMGVSLSAAAIALTKNQKSNIGLDYSPEAIAAFGCTLVPNPQPVVVTFKGSFPDGSSVCLNCGEVIGPCYADADAACVDRCKDLHAEGGVLAVPPDNNPARRFATFVTGDRVRVMVTDNHDGSANVTYFLLPAAWPPDVTDGLPLRTTGPAPYPFRVDATLAQPGATLADVHIVRIK